MFGVASPSPSLGVIMTEPASIAPTPLNASGRLRYLFLALVAFNIVMLIVTVIPLLRGEANTYHNQHARLVTGALTGLLLASSFLVRVRVKWILIAAAFLCLGVQYVLIFT